DFWGRKPRTIEQSLPANIQLPIVVPGFGNAPAMRIELSPRRSRSRAAEVSATLKTPLTLRA
ncbi:MAG TPA: hypothetical protein VK641_13350, partial [Terriglobales bacterium]|nr:hypothetical protein [Terriglobales bacterium]